MRNTEKTFGRIMTIVAFVLCSLMINKCDAQVVVRELFETKGEKVVMKSKAEDLVLKNPLIGGDDILLNVFSDSIDVKTITFAMFAYFPKGIDPKGSDIVITYKDGTTDVFKQTRFIKENNYAEYQPVISINNIYIKPVKTLMIRGIAKYDIDKNYFTEFFANL